MFARTAAVASILAVVTIAASPAFAACDNDERPPTPFDLKAAPKRGAESSAILFTWRWRFWNKGNRVFWDIETTDGAGKIVDAPAGIDGVSARWNFIKPREYANLAPGTRRCLRVRARTEGGTQGCVSAAWAGPVCATTTAPPAPKGGFAALAANGKGFWGYAVGQGSDAQARDAALKGCGQADCKIAISGQSRCIAYYDSRQGGAYWYGLAMGGSVSYVRRIALGGCASGAPRGTCRLVKVICS